MIDVPGMSSDQAMRVITELFRRAAASGMPLEQFLLHEQNRILLERCEYLEAENRRLVYDKELDRKAREVIAAERDELRNRLKEKR